VTGRPASAIRSEATQRVPFPQASTSPRFVRGLEDDQLITPDPPPAVGYRPGLRGRRAKRCLPGIDDDEIVAQAVHLDEGTPAGHDAHPKPRCFIITGWRPDAMEKAVWNGHGRGA
jgi:hypothetical protein